MISVVRASVVLLAVSALVSAYSGFSVVAYNTNDINQYDTSHGRATPRPPSPPRTPGSPPAEEEYSHYYEDYSPPTTSTSTERARVCSPPLPASDVLAPGTTRTASWRKCIEYQQAYVFPCEEQARAMGPGAAPHEPHEPREPREPHARRCGAQVRARRVVAGSDAAPGEFPHMVMLSNKKSAAELAAAGSWMCGGTIISEVYILTAAHCDYLYSEGKRLRLQYARSHATAKSEPIMEERNVHKIAKIIPHPGYKPPKKYNDIALLKTLRPMHLDALAVPACLDVEPTAPLPGGAVDPFVTATGWGLTQRYGRSADVLQKVLLEWVDIATCSQQHRSRDSLKEGLDENTMLCYHGANNTAADTCEGDSGGAVVVRQSQVTCMYTVVGVTSFGASCGGGRPGVYTRVAAYRPWIESIVWPAELVHY